MPICGPSDQPLVASGHRGLLSQDVEYEQLVARYQASVTYFIAVLHEVREARHRLHDVTKAKFKYSQTKDILPEVERMFFHLAGQSCPQVGSAIEELSSRELEVFVSIGRGLTTHEIANRLDIAESTVETYRERLKTKLQINSGSALIRCAILWTVLSE
jgi:DNA-binding NarL/FixJ family response regulator